MRCGPPRCRSLMRSRDGPAAPRPPPAAPPAPAEALIREPRSRRLPFLPRPRPRTPAGSIWPWPTLARPSTAARSGLTPVAVDHARLGSVLPRPPCCLRGCARPASALPARPATRGLCPQGPAGVRGPRVWPELRLLASLQVRVPGLCGEGGGGEGSRRGRQVGRPVPVPAPVPVPPHRALGTPLAGGGVIRPAPPPVNSVRPPRARAGATPRLAHTTTTHTTSHPHHHRPHHPPTHAPAPPAACHASLRPACWRRQRRRRPWRCHHARRPGP